MSDARTQRGCTPRVTPAARELAGHHRFELVRCGFTELIGAIRKHPANEAPRELGMPTFVVANAREDVSNGGILRAGERFRRFYRRDAATKNGRPIPKQAAHWW